ncbi:MAG TPA: DUF2252 family protein [Polyangia bacterium]|nr:DUF2252 family protein [Polyangia bacterium]
MTEELIASTRRYEAWLGRLMPLVAADLRQKHRRMAVGPFFFLRGTFYRWCQLWPAAAGDLARVTKVLSVGDLHLENYGTWRDADGRLIWGINDFDEATTLPWTQDLVRLAVSAHLAILSDQLAVRRRSACDAIVTGYRDGLQAGGRPFVLEEEHGWLRRLATGELRHAPTFWARMNALPAARAVDPSAAAAIQRAMPARGLPIRFARRVAGLGSLGRPRFVGIADWNGGAVAREAKAMAPSAWLWAQGRVRGRATDYNAIIARAVRVPDPTVRVMGRWLLRRLAPHCTRIDLAELPTSRDEERLLYAMGFEAANVHLGSPGARPALRRELTARRSRWLHQTATAMTDQVLADWRTWREQVSDRGPRRAR